MRTRLHSVTTWSAVVLWATMIFILSSIPGSALPPGRYSTLGHFTLYFVLGALVFAALDGDLRSRALSAIAIASAYGVSDELHQLFVPGRCADPIDWLVDTLGALTAIVLILFILRPRASRRKD